MRKLSIIRNLICLVAISLLAYSCGKSTDDYVNSLPDNSIFTFAFNSKSLKDKANVGDFTQSSFYKVITKGLDESEISDEAKQYITSLIENPEKSGIDQDKDGFVFMSFDKESTYGPSPEIGFLSKMKNKAEFEALCDFLVKEREGEFEKRTAEGFDVLVLSEDGNPTSLVAYDDVKCLVLLSGNDYDKTFAKLDALMKQGKENSLAANKHFAEALNGSHDMLMAISMKSMPEEFTEIYKNMPLGFSAFKDATIIAPINFEKGKIVMEMMQSFSDSKLEKEYLETFGNIYMPMKDNGLLKYFPENSVGAIGVGMNGKELYQTLTKIDQIKMAVAAMPQIEKIVSALDGNIAFSFNEMHTFGEAPYSVILPRLSFIAEINDKSVMETIVTNLEQFGMPLKDNETEPYRYEMHLGGSPYNMAYYGLKDNMLYFTTDATVLAALNGEKINSMEKKFGHVFTNNMTAMAVDFVALRAMLNEMANADPYMARSMAPVMSLLPLLEAIESMELWGNMQKGVWVTNMTDKEKNSLETFYVLFNTMIEKYLTLDDQYRRTTVDVTYNDEGTIDHEVVIEDIPVE